MTTTISIPQGTIVGRIDGGTTTLVTLSGSVYVEATRETDGSWAYNLGKKRFVCAGSSGTPLPRQTDADWQTYFAPGGGSLQDIEAWYLARP